MKLSARNQLKGKIIEVKKGVSSADSFVMEAVIVSANVDADVRSSCWWA